VQLRLDHLIIRAADPAETMAEVSRRTGAPILADVGEVAGLAGGILRAGTLDIEVLRIGREPPPRPHGYGAGFVADAGLRDVAADLRARGFATSPAARGVAGEGAGRRTWRALQVKGLLPDPFPAPAGRRRPGRLDRALEAAADAMSRIPALARAATGRAGGSMVVVTEYEFDVEVWRRTAGSGPDVTAVHLGTGGHIDAWQRLPLAGDAPLHLHDDGPPGITRVVLAGGAWPRPQVFTIGDVAFELS
jgi:hypothetical protein